MSIPSQRTPNQQDVVAITKAVFGQPPQSVHRFQTGLCHYVYEVLTASQQSVVVRIARPEMQALLKGGVLWSEVLRSQNLPLPAQLHADFSATIVPFAFVVLERLPGQDLGHVYADLSKREKQTIADSIVRIQSTVQTLPMGKGYGCITSLTEMPPYSTWLAVVEAMITQSEQTLSQTLVKNAAFANSTYPMMIDQLKKLLSRFSPYLLQVAPTPFLDDITTKNVLVSQGKFSGIVDVDEICYGDSLWTIGLTQTALLKQKQSLDYIESWVSCLNLTSMQQRIVNFYSAVFCVNFLSELGQVFNKGQAEVPNQAMIEHLLNTLNRCLEACEKMRQ